MSAVTSYFSLCHSMGQLFFSFFMLVFVLQKSTYTLLFSTFRSVCPLWPISLSPSGGVTTQLPRYATGTRLFTCITRISSFLNSDAYFFHYMWCKFAFEKKVHEVCVPRSVICDPVRQHEDCGPMLRIVDFSTTGKSIFLPF